MKERLIKKYKNRRLYDTEISQYITVDDLQRYVIEGVLFLVEDSVSGKDITKATLLQILVEMEACSTQFMSKNMLCQLIILAEHPMNKSLYTMLAQMMTMTETQLQSPTYMESYQQATKILNQQAKQFLSQWEAIFKPRKSNDDRRESD